MDLFKQINNLPSELREMIYSFTDAAHFENVKNDMELFNFMAKIITTDPVLHRKLVHALDPSEASRPDKSLLDKRYLVQLKKSQMVEDFMPFCCKAFYLRFSKDDLADIVITYWEVSPLYGVRTDILYAYCGSKKTYHLDLLRNKLKMN